MNDDAMSAQDRAERDAHLVKSSDDMAREAAGVPHPEPGHHVEEYRRYVMEAEGRDPVIDREELKAELKAEILAELGSGSDRMSVDPDTNEPLD